MSRTLVVLLVSLAACQPAPVGVRNVELQPDSTPQCAQLCAQIGLPLDSVVIMANRVGCVCRAAPSSSAPPGAPGAPGASAAGGMAGVLLDEEAARQQQQHQQNSYKPVKY